MMTAAAKPKPWAIARPRDLMPLMLDAARVLGGIRYLGRASGEADLEAEAREIEGELRTAISSNDVVEERRVLTGLQGSLARWTANSTAVCGDAGVQRFRQRLHAALDHDEGGGGA